MDGMLSETLTRYTFLETQSVSIKHENKLMMVCSQKLWLYKSIKNIKNKYRWCGIRGYYPTQINWGRKK